MNRSVNFMYRKSKNHRAMWFVRIIVAGMVVLITSCGVLGSGTQTNEINETQPSTTENRIELILPFSAENPPYSMIPMGDILLYSPPIGHPGIDFYWEEKPQLLAVADGTVKINPDITFGSLGEKYWSIYLNSGDYVTIYGGLADYNQDLVNESPVKKGDFIGVPHSTNAGQSYVFHWSFQSKKNEVLPLCPLTYLDATSQTRLEEIWQNTTEYSQKASFPKICNGVFDGLDSVAILSQRVEQLISEGQIVNGQKERTMDENELRQANASLANGFVLEDGQGDFHRFIEGFGLPAFDLRSLTIGADEEYLYMKFQMWDVFNDQNQINGHTIIATGLITDFRLASSEHEVTPFGTGSADLLQVSLAVGSGALQVIPYYLLNVPDGLYENEWQGYGVVGASVDILYAGGQGEDWVLVAWPLKYLGAKLDDDAVVMFSTETGSTTEDHLVIDPLLARGDEKCSASIRFKLGQADYTLDYTRCGTSESQVVVNPDITQPPPPQLITPYMNESDISSINEAYSQTDDAPWGFTHPGIDFMITQDLVPFQAVMDGLVTNFSFARETNQMGWHYGFCIDNQGFLVCYNFETFSGEDEIGALQDANIFVKDGFKVKQGDLIGNLVYGGSGAHVDFGVIAGVSQPRSCPEPYFTDEARESILRLIQKDHTDWPICVEPAP